MSQHLLLELPDDVFAQLESQATVAGMTPEEWATWRLASPFVGGIAEPAHEGNGRVSDQPAADPDDLERRRAAFRAVMGSVSIADDSWSDNERIDAEFAREAAGDRDAS